jgi:hypothetical protein
MSKAKNKIKFKNGSTIKLTEGEEDALKGYSFDYFFLDKRCLNAPKTWWQKIKFYFKPWKLKYSDKTAMEELENLLKVAYNK